MEYFNSLAALLTIERKSDEEHYNQLLKHLSVNARREAGLAWYPIIIKNTEVGKGDYLSLEIERSVNADLPHSFRFGMPVTLFSNHNKDYTLSGTITYVNHQQMRIALRIDELPEWVKDGKLGVQLLFDDKSYDEMQYALQKASKLFEDQKAAPLHRLLTGNATPSFNTATVSLDDTLLNESQKKAVQNIIQANELAIVHGPPGTGKTTTLVAAIQSMLRLEQGQILVTAPSNTAVDVLSDRLHAAGIKVLRIGNPARVSESLQAITLDEQINQHASFKDIKKLKKQAAAYRDMAQKYKRNFGHAEREQRRALFEEARKLIREVDKTEQYITEQVLNKAQVLTATLIGAAHDSIRNRQYQTIVIDEAGQAIEPACWVPILKGTKLILGGDHLQLPPTVKSQNATELSYTLLEKMATRHPEAVTLLTEQYRMHQDIMTYPSETFYTGKLTAHNTVQQHLIFPTDEAFLFIDTAGSGFEEKAENESIINEEEAAFTLKHIQHYWEKLLTQHISNLPTIAIIAPYRKQVQLLKNLVEQNTFLQPYLHQIQVNTIDGFQGQEKDIVYISLTRSNNNQQIGFLKETRRMNVAMTRARKKLVIIGDSSTIGQSAFYNGMQEYAISLNSYQSVWEYMDI